MNQKDKTINKIKSKGYWVINIHPEVYQEKRIEQRSKIKDVVRNAVVGLRGWDYPHYFSVGEHEPYIIGNCMESFKDWENHIEFWRMTQSANFVHLLALREDWSGNIKYQNVWAPGDKSTVEKILSVFNTLYTLTEIFEFAKRLVQQNIFDPNVVIQLTLYDLLDRHLLADSWPRIMPHVSKTYSWPWINTYPVEDILNKTYEFAFDAFRDLIDLFGWDNPPIDMLKNEQQKFVQGKI
ncbi:MAG TPA: hypothetical protein ACFYD3_00500 [Candidatus Hypogeohydataceae bacterium YC41]